MTTPALLVLEDGTVFNGIAVGAEGVTVGEVVFNTSMTGYQEILTDPSYSHQIVTLTYPHIGNTGTNSQDVESNQIHARALVIRDLPITSSNFRSEQSLTSYLKDNHIIAIAELDTRKLTRILREKGALSGCIMAGNINTEQALEKAQQFAGLKGMDLAKLVSTQESYLWLKGSWRLKPIAITEKVLFSSHFKVVAYDFGIKQNILRMLVDRGCDVTVVPAQTPAEEVIALKPDGIFLSNGPGDPEPCDYAIDSIKTLLNTQIPIFGICLGHQLLALACGAKTMKMKFGHHGANHPVKDLQSDQVMITSQNHGFAVDEASLPDCLVATHKSLFDGSLQGIKHTHKPALSFQGHPEASPGPHDCASLFENFIQLICQYRQQ